MSRPTRSTFTRCQRLSVGVSLLYLTMITNCMFFKGEGEKSEQQTASSVKLGPITFTMQQVFISFVSTMIIFPVNIIMVTIFKKVKPKNNAVMQKNQQLSSKKYKWRAISSDSALMTNPEKARSEKFKASLKNIITLGNHDNGDKYEEDGLVKKKKKKPMLFPYWTLYIAWILCWLAILTSAFFTILYSMEWGNEKSVEWLTTFILSFFENVIIVQPVKVLILAAIISIILKKPELEDEEAAFDAALNIPTADEQEDMTQDRERVERIAFQRKMAASNLRPPDMESLKAAREHRIKEIEMEAIVKEMLSYFVFLVVIFFLSYQTRSSSGYLMGDTVRNLFTNSFSLNKVDSFWPYMQDKFLPNLYTSGWYNGKPMNWREQLCINDGNCQTIRVGIGRLRQLRIKPNSCKVNPDLAPMIPHCRNDYNFIDDDAKAYLPEWVKPAKSNYSKIDELENPWVYQSSLKLLNTPFMGRYALYKGGGYVANFKRSKSGTVQFLKKLEEQGWVDFRTKAMFLEFTLYNANVNLFTSVQMVFEFMSAGSVATYYDYKIFRLFSYVGSFGVIVITAEVIFGIFVIYFLQREIRRILKQRLKYFKDFWNKLEFGTLCGCIVCVAMYIMRKIMSSVALDNLKKSGSADFVNFQAIALWDSIYGAIQGFLVFFATVKFIKILKFNRRMGMLGSTIKAATKDLKIFTIVFSIYFMAFCMFAYLVFGRSLGDYETFITTIESLFAFSLGSFDFHAFKAADGVLGPIFFFLFIQVVVIGLMGMFLTIIYDAFATVKANAELQSNDYELVEFMVKKIKILFGYPWGKSKPEGEDNEDGDEETGADIKKQMEKEAANDPPILNLVKM